MQLLEKLGPSESAQLLEDMRVKIDAGTLNNPSAFASATLGWSSLVIRV